MAQKKIKRKSRSKAGVVPFVGLAQVLKSVEEGFSKPSFPSFRVGDAVRVEVRILEGSKERIQAFEGVVIAIRHAGSRSSFTVRKVSHAVGVERVFLFYSPKVISVKVLSRGKVRRAKLYYLRNLVGKAARVEKDLVREMKERKQKAASSESTSPTSNS